MLALSTLPQWLCTFKHSPCSMDQTCRRPNGAGTRACCAGAAAEAEEAEAELGEVDESLACEGCGSRARGDQMLLCDNCDAAYHMACLDPPLSGELGRERERGATAQRLIPLEEAAWGSFQMWCPDQAVPWAPAAHAHRPLSVAAPLPARPMLAAAPLQAFLRATGSALAATR